MKRLAVFALDALWHTVVVAIGVVVTLIALGLLVIACNLVAMLLGAV